jgi:hypothetical protein
VLVELSVLFGQATVPLEVHSTRSEVSDSMCVILWFTSYLLHFEELVLLVEQPSSDADVTPASSSIWNK